MASGRIQLTLSRKQTAKHQVWNGDLSVGTIDKQPTIASFPTCDDDDGDDDYEQNKVNFKESQFYG